MSFPHSLAGYLGNVTLHRQGKWQPFPDWRSWKSKHHERNQDQGLWFSGHQRVAAHVRQYQKLVLTVTPFRMSHNIPTHGCIMGSSRLPGLSMQNSAGSQAKNSRDTQTFLTGRIGLGHTHWPQAKALALSLIFQIYGTLLQQITASPCYKMQHPTDPLNTHQKAFGDIRLISIKVELDYNAWSAFVDCNICVKIRHHRGEPTV